MTVTWATALLDPAVQLHWLLDITVGGEVLRLSDIDTSVGPHQYAGVLVMSSDPVLLSDPYTGDTGAVAATVDILPRRDGGVDRTLFRTLDLADTYAVELIGVPVDLWRWAEGSAETERDLVIRGHITEARTSSDNILTLGIADFTVFYSAKILPPLLIELTTFPDAPEDDIGRRAPIVYGTFSGLEVPQHVATGDKHIIGHHVGSITSGKVDETSNTPSLTNTALADGTEYAELDFSIATDGLTAVVNGTGALDDDAGTYTDTPDALIVHTADQVLHLAREIVGIPAELVDVFSFRAARNKTLSHVNTIIIDAGESVNYFVVAGAALAPYRGTVCSEHGQLVVRLADFDAEPSASLIFGVNLSAVDSVEWTGYQQVPAGLELEYGRRWDRKRKQYREMSRLVVEAADYLPFAESQARGGTKLKLKYPYILDSATAEALIAGLKELYSKNRRKCAAVVSRETHDILLYSVVTVTHADGPSRNGEGWADKRFLVIGVQYGTEEQTLALLEC